MIVDESQLCSGSGSGSVELVDDLASCSVLSFWESSAEQCFTQSGLTWQRVENKAAHSSAKTQFGLHVA